MRGLEFQGFGIFGFGIFGIAPSLQDIAGKLIRFDCFSHSEIDISPLFVYMFFIFISYGYPSFQS